MCKEQPLLSVRNLKTIFYKNNVAVNAVNNISFDLKARKTLAIVGESGCGKSVTCLSILRLIDYPGKIINGEILLNGKDLMKLSEKELKNIRGKDISMIFQNPMTSLNPIITIGNHLVETIKSHYKISNKDAKNIAIDILKKVGLRDAEKILKKFSFQLSGGMRQRIAIAMALCLKPQIIIADEPTTALDVTVQAQILFELRKLKEQLNSSIIFVTHDLGVVAQIADEVAIMYAGSIIECGDVVEIFQNPIHPYTKALLNSIPKLNQTEKLKSIPGSLPNLMNLTNECAFKYRCSNNIERCTNEVPILKSISNNHKVACFYTSNDNIERV